MAWMKVFSKSVWMTPAACGACGAQAYGPLPHLVGARGEEAAEGEGLAHGEDDLRQARLGAEALALGGDLGLGVEAREAVLEDDGERDDGVAGRVLLDPGVDLGQVLVLLPQVVLLGEVDEVDDRLGGEEHERVDYFDLVLGEGSAREKKKTANQCFDGGSERTLSH